MKSVVSLFSGCGGFDLGFKAAGFEIIRAFDIDPIAIANYNRNVGGEGVVADLTTDFSRRMVSRLRPDLVLCGSPCQGFSTAGKRVLDDPRNDLLVLGSELAVSMKPELIICENVPAVKSGAHRLYWERAASVFRDNGYRVDDYIFDMSKYGLPQIRKRVFMVASLSDMFLSPKESDDVASLDDVLLGCSKQKNHVFSKIHELSKDYKIARSILPGKKLSNVRGGDSSVHTWDIPSVYGRTNKAERDFLNYFLKARRRCRERRFGDADPVTIKRLIEDYSGAEVLIERLIKKEFLICKGNGKVDIKNTFNGKYRRLDGGKPSLTVDTNFGNPKYFIHPRKDRGFSVREAARIQGFPDSYIFEGPVKSQFRIIGNAVPPMFARKLADTILDQGAICLSKNL